MAYLTKASDEILLDKDAADGDDMIGGFVDYDEGELSGGREALLVKGRRVCLAGIGHDGEDRELTGASA